MDSPLAHAVGHPALSLLTGEIIHADDACKTHGPQPRKVIFQEALPAVVQRADRDRVRVLRSLYQNPSPFVISAGSLSRVNILLVSPQLGERDCLTVFQFHPGISQKQALPGVVGIALLAVQRFADKFQLQGTAFRAQRNVQLSGPQKPGIDAEMLQAAFFVPQPEFIGIFLS